MANEIEFALFAPYNTEALLIGEFSDWEPIPMTKGDDGYFRAEVALEDGTYQYKFRVRSKSPFFEPDAWVDVNDPYATAIDDTGDGNSIAVVKKGQRVIDDYVWRHDGADLPSDHELILYELHIGDFTPEGTYRAAAERLDYLAELGVTAVELMPVMEFPGEQSWGYNPRHFFAPESSYGSSGELKHLIDECHARGIRVILDLVCNHAEADHPLTKIDYAYWFQAEPSDPEHNWGPEFDYGRYDEQLDIMPARKFMGDVVHFWVHEYHIDGYRFDAVKQLGDPDFLKWVVGEAKRAAGEKPFYTVAEHIPERPELIGPEGPFDGSWHDSFYHGLSALLRGEGDMESFKRLLDARERGFAGPTNLVNYPASHDHDHLMSTLQQAGITGEEAFKRAKLAAVLTVTALGVPMVWMGTELGMAAEKTIEENKFPWELLDEGPNRELYETWRGLIALRRQNDALKRDAFEFVHEDPEAEVLAYQRWNDEGSRVLVIANLGPHPHGEYRLEGMPESGVWHEWTRDYDLEVHGGALTLELPAFEARVLVL